MTRTGKYGILRRNNGMERVEAEFGESIVDIIIGLRNDGHNWKTVAGAMNVPVLTLFRWRREIGLEINQANRKRSKPDNVDNLW